MLRKAFYALATVALTTSASAQTFLMSGEGLAPCGTYLEHRRGANLDQHYAYVVWTRGFMSGFNHGTRGKQTEVTLESATVLAYLDKHCRDNPLAVVGAGAVFLVKELGGKR